MTIGYWVAALCWAIAAVDASDSLFEVKIGYDFLESSFTKIVEQYVHRYSEALSERFDSIHFSLRMPSRAELTLVEEDEDRVQPLSQVKDQDLISELEAGSSQEEAASTKEAIRSKQTLRMKFPIELKSYQDEGKRLLDSHQHVIKHQISARTHFTLELIPTVDAEGHPHFRIKHGADCKLLEWQCKSEELEEGKLGKTIYIPAKDAKIHPEHYLSKQECRNIKLELEKYLSQRVLLFHNEEHANHLDHFNQVAAFKTLNGLIRGANALSKSVEKRTGRRSEFIFDHGSSVLKLNFGCRACNEGRIEEHRLAPNELSLAFTPGNALIEETSLSQEGSLMENLLWEVAQKIKVEDDVLKLEEEVELSVVSEVKGYSSKFGTGQVLEEKRGNYSQIIQPFVAFGASYELICAGLHVDKPKIAIESGSLIVSFQKTNPRILPRIPGYCDSSEQLHKVDPRSLNTNKTKMAEVRQTLSTLAGDDTARVPTGFIPQLEAYLEGTDEYFSLSPLVHFITAYPFFEEWCRLAATGSVSGEADFLRNKSEACAFLLTTSVNDFDFIRDKRPMKHLQERAWAIKRDWSVHFHYLREFEHLNLNEYISSVCISILMLGYGLNFFEFPIKPWVLKPFMLFLNFVFSLTVLGDIQPMYERRLNKELNRIANGGTPPGFGFDLLLDFIFTKTSFGYEVVAISSILVANLLFWVALEVAYFEPTFRVDPHLNFKYRAVPERQTDDDDRSPARLKSREEYLEVEQVLKAQIVAFILLTNQSARMFFQFLIGRQDARGPLFVDGLLLALLFFYEVKLRDKWMKEGVGLKKTEPIWVCLISSIAYARDYPALATSLLVQGFIEAENPTIYAICFSICSPIAIISSYWSHELNPRSIWWTFVPETLKHGSLPPALLTLIQIGAILHLTAMTFSRWPFIHRRVAHLWQRQPLNELPKLHPEFDEQQRKGQRIYLLLTSMAIQQAMSKASDSYISQAAFIYYLPLAFELLNLPKLATITLFWLCCPGYPILMYLPTCLTQVVLIIVSVLLILVGPQDYPLAHRMKSVIKVEKLE